MTIASSMHILIDDQGVARIDGTRMKVIHLVKEMRARKAGPDQLKEAFPDLSLAQIHAALAYYYDHQSQLDAMIEAESAAFDADRAGAPHTPGRRRPRRVAGSPATNTGNLVQ